MTISKEILDELLKGVERPEDLLGDAVLTVRDIQAHLLDLYGLKVSPDLISRVTAAVLDEVREWQSRALDRIYPIVLFDALRVKIRDAGNHLPEGQDTGHALKINLDHTGDTLHCLNSGNRRFSNPDARYEIRMPYRCHRSTR